MRVVARWGQHVGILREAVQEMRKAEAFMDCVIIADGGKVPVHKVVLAAFSPYFENFLKETSNSSSFVLAPGASYESMKLFVDFMYDGKMTLKMEELDPLLEMATKFQLKGIEHVLTHVQRHCGQQMGVPTVDATAAPTESRGTIGDPIVKQSPKPVAPNNSLNGSVGASQTEPSVAEGGTPAPAASVIPNRSPSPVIVDVGGQLPYCDLPISGIAGTDIDLEYPDEFSSLEDIPSHVSSMIFSGSSPEMTDLSDTECHSFTATSVAHLLEATKSISMRVGNHSCSECRSPSPETLALVYSMSPPVCTPSQRKWRGRSESPVRRSPVRRRGRLRTRRRRTIVSSHDSEDEHTLGDTEAQATTRRGTTDKEVHEGRTICANLNDWSMFESSTISKRTPVAESSSKKEQFSSSKYDGARKKRGRRTSQVNHVAHTKETNMCDGAGPSCQ